MARRVIIDSTAASPLRISVAGVDAAGAEFNNLIFDANQSPLRLWATGWGSIAGMTWNERLAGKNVNESTLASGFTTPSGTTPIFMTCWRLSNDALNRLFTPSFDPSSNAITGGGGGAVCSGSFIGVAFTVGTPSAPDTAPAVTYVNYCVFKNYN